MKALEKIIAFEERNKTLPFANKPDANDEYWRFSPSHLWAELVTLPFNNSFFPPEKNADLTSFDKLDKGLVEIIVELLDAHLWEKTYPFLQEMDAHLSQAQVLLVKGERDLESPIVLNLSAQQPINFLPCPLIVIFDKKAKGRVVIRYEGKSPNLSSLRVVALEESVAYLDILEKTHGTWAMFEQVILLDKAKLKHSFLSLGSGSKRRDTTLILKGRDSLCQARSAYFSRDHDYKEMLIRQQHLGQYSESLVLEKGVVSEKAYNVLNGIIQVFPHASYSQAYLTNNNLHLHDGARSHSIPRLEIQENEVKCSHSSTACLLDPNHLFYMSTRGLPDQEARQILTRSFLEEALQEAHKSLVEELAYLTF